MADLKFLVETRQNKLVDGQTVSGPWHLIASFAHREHAENFAALKGLHGMPSLVEYRVVP